MSDTAWGYFIDFWVILFADIGAAFVAIVLFEAKKADRDRSEASLNELFQLADHFERYYRGELARVTPHNHLSHQIASYIDDESRLFESLGSNILFWQFVGGKRFKRRYSEILKIRTLAHQQQTAPDVHTTLQKLISEFVELKSEIEKKFGTRPWLLRIFYGAKDG